MFIKDPIQDMKLKLNQALINTLKKSQKKTNQKQNSSIMSLTKSVLWESEEYFTTRTIS